MTLHLVIKDKQALAARKHYNNDQYNCKTTKHHGSSSNSINILSFFLSYVAYMLFYILWFIPNLQYRLVK